MIMRFFDRMKSYTGLAILLTLCSVYSLTIVPPIVQARPFGIEQFSIQTTVAEKVAERNGYRVVNRPYSFTQAGGHPSGLTTRILFDTEEYNHGPNGESRSVVPTQDPKDVVVDIPPGLIGDPQATPRCSLTNVTDKQARCPADTQVGTARTHFSEPSKEAFGPIYNVVPEAGQTAEFALVTQGSIFLAEGHLVRSGPEEPEGRPAPYAVTVVSNGIPEVEIPELEVTFWGTP